jgi:hypothetical protein
MTEIEYLQELLVKLQTVLRHVGDNALLADTLVNTIASVRARLRGLTVN